MRESDYYPAGAYSDPNAPYNQVDVPEKDFEVTCIQTLSRTATVTTNNYIPGAEGCDYEDGVACGWQDPDDTSDTDWSKEYNECGYQTPLQLIQLLQEYLEKDLENVAEVAKNIKQNEAFLKGKLEHLIEECKCWNEDETEFVED